MDFILEKEIQTVFDLVVSDHDWLVFFDFDRDGRVDGYEQSILHTVVRREIELADGHPTEWLETRASIVLNERYRILGRLSAGGQATTELAYDHQSREPVVVKRIALREVDEWKSVELFQRESAVLKSLNHRYIPTFLDAFAVGDPPNTFCIVQQFIAGEPLSHRIDNGKTFTDEEALHVADRVLEILTYIHGHNPPVVHRDIKPENLIVAPDGAVYLIDFGAASQKVTTPEGGSTVVGTHGYMPQEQYMGVVSPATDLYALGATLLHMLCGEPPGSLPFSHGKIQFEDRIADSKLLPFVSVLLEPIAEDRPDSVEDARALLSTKPERPAIGIAELAIVEAEQPWLVKSSRTTSTSYYVDGETSFRIAISDGELKIRDQNNPYGFWVLAAGALAAMVAAGIWTMYAGLLCGVIAIVAWSVLPKNAHVIIDDKSVHWTRSVQRHEVLRFVPKRNRVFIHLADREVELTIPCTTHEQATFVSQLLNLALANEPTINEKTS